MSRTKTQEFAEEEYVQAFAQILLLHMSRELDELLFLEDEENQHYPFFIEAMDFIDWEPHLAPLVFAHPTDLLCHFDKALLLAQQQRTLPFQEHEQLQQTSVDKSIKHNAHVRFLRLPPVGATMKAISMIRSTDSNKLIQVSGTVVRTRVARVLEASRKYKCCNSKCGFIFEVKSDPAQGNLLEVPKVCPSANIAVKKCKSVQFQMIEGSSDCRDYQEIKIQEHVQKIGVGSIPRSIVVILENDLVEASKAGDDVAIVGIVLTRWKPSYQGIRCDLETVIQANSVRLCNEQAVNNLVREEHKKEFQEFWLRYPHRSLIARNKIVSGICPQVYGLYQVKLAIALIVIGGCSHVDKSGMQTRGESHMLLIGDPGTGKSQFLRFTASLAARSVLTTGIGTTSAGLTCSAVKDGSEWTLEAGALVLADRGICCIDEFSGIRNSDRTSIHEAMEQQTLSVAKAGLVCKLNTRTTVFAVTNPKGKYDLGEDVSVNTAIDSPLLSRFDIIMVLLDTPNAEWDKTVSSFVLAQATNQHKNDEPLHSEYTDSGEGAWSLSKLQSYIRIAKDTHQPKLSDDAIQILRSYYQLQRSADTRTAARTTIRLLESLTRISQAHARLMMQDEVQVQDAIVAVSIVESSLATTSILGVNSVLHAGFPEDPEEAYFQHEDTILNELHLRELSTRTGTTARPRDINSSKADVSQDHISRHFTNDKENVALNNPFDYRKQSLRNTQVNTFDWKHVSRRSVRNDEEEEKHELPKEQYENTAEHISTSGNVDQFDHRRAYKERQPSRVDEAQKFPRLTQSTFPQSGSTGTSRPSWKAMVQRRSQEGYSRSEDNWDN